MSRMFRSDDTSLWVKKFGDGTVGPATLSGTYGSSNQGAYAIGVCTGTSGETSLTTPNGWSGAYHVWIHQTQGTGVGNNEFNYISSISGTTSTLLYPLQNTYATGAQVSLLVPYNNITISGSLTPAAWNGTVGGIICLLDLGTTTISGSLTASGKGFRGGPATVGKPGRQGEGSPAAGGTQTNDANGNGGGGGGANTGTSNGGGGGGANGANGGAGSTVSGAVGVADGNAGLTDIVMGGGGGSGGSGTSVGAGGIGGGIIVIASRVLSNSGSILSSGTNGAGSAEAGGGGGAGGSILIKTQTATLGTITASGGSGGDGTLQDGGAGSVGRVHIDYLVSYSGSSTPTLDPRQDFFYRLSQSQSVII